MQLLKITARPSEGTMMYQYKIGKFVSPLYLEYDALIRIANILHLDFKIKHIYERNSTQQENKRNEASRPVKSRAKRPEKRN